MPVDNTPPLQHEVSSSEVAILVGELDKRVEQRFELNDKALAAALLAAEKAIQAVLIEKERADTLSDLERGKTAEVLRAHLEETIKSVYAQLSQHIAEQVKQINAAMEASNSMALVRDENVQALLQASLLAAREAADKLERTNEKRFDSVNEFRSQLSDQAATFIPREVYETAQVNIAKQISMLQSRADTQAGSAAGTRALFAGATTVVTIVISIIILLANHSFA